MTDDYLNSARDTDNKYPVYYVPPKLTPEEKKDKLQNNLVFADNQAGNEIQPAVRQGMEKAPGKSTTAPVVQQKPKDITREFHPNIEEEAKEDNFNTSKYYPQKHLGSIMPPESKNPLKESVADVALHESEPQQSVTGGTFPKKNKRALAKLGVFLLVIIIFGSATTVTATRMYSDQLYRAAKGVLYSAPLKTTVWQSYGSVSEAELILPLQTPNGRVDQDFLLDTGAVVSSLPREMAEKMGYDLAFLPRQTFKGFGNTTSFAYNAEMVVHFDNKEITLPVVFTESPGSKALLGRKGLFDKFTILVDHKSQLVEIRE